MSITTGWEIEVPAPPLAKRARGLLEDALVPISLSSEWPTDPGQRNDANPVARIESGVTYCTLGCSPVNGWQDDVCAEVQAELTNPDDAEAVTFSSFVVTADETSPARFSPAWIRSRLRARMSVGLSPQLATELQTGTLTGNPALKNVTHLVATAVPPAAAMFQLEDIMADFEARQFYIHMDPGTFIEMDRVMDFTWDGGAWLTANGHRIIADPGYSGTAGPIDPDTPAGSPIAADVDGRWIYASLPVSGWVGPERTLGDFTGGFNMGHNDYTDAILRPALLAFDPCVVIAVQAEVPQYTVDTA